MPAENHYISHFSFSRLSELLVAASLRDEQVPESCLACVFPFTQSETARMVIVIFVDHVCHISGAKRRASVFESHPETQIQRRNEHGENSEPSLKLRLNARRGCTISQLVVQQWFETSPRASQVALQPPAVPLQEFVLKSEQTCCPRLVRDNPMHSCIQACMPACTRMLGDCRT